jgi:hypothetical protein
MSEFHMQHGPMEVKRFEHPAPPSLLRQASRLHPPRRTFMAFENSPMSSNASVATSTETVDMSGSEQRAAPTQSFNELSDTHIALGRKTRAESVAVLNQLLVPDGHPKLLHLWPVKLLQAGRSDYDDSGVMAMRAAASFRR